MEPKGRAKGGRARANSLSPERRKQIAAAAAKQRWANPRPDPKREPSEAMRLAVMQVQRDWKAYNRSLEQLFALMDVHHGS